MGRLGEKKKGDEEDEDDEPIDVSLFVPKSPSDNTKLQLTRGKPKTTQARTIAFLSPMNSRTPGKGQVLGGKHPEHDIRAKNCEGAIYQKRVAGPSDKAGKDMCNSCHICKNKT